MCYGTRRLLLNNSAFIPYLIDALLLDPDHSRQKLTDNDKSWCQRIHTECLAQLLAARSCKIRQ